LRLATIPLAAWLSSILVIPFISAIPYFSLRSKAPQQLYFRLFAAYILLLFANIIRDE
jgi:hypothetical protein